MTEASTPGQPLRYPLQRRQPAPRLFSAPPADHRDLISRTPFRSQFSMTTVAVPPAAAPLPLADRAPSPRSFPVSTAPTSTTATTSELPMPKRARSGNGSPHSSDGQSSPSEKAQSNGKSPPIRNGPLSSVRVKKEPTSPSTSSRPRPKRLDLSSSGPNSRGPQTARPLTSRDSAGLQIQDVGLACLSPGFQTNDPSMREQLQRSLDVRDQQRQIIEARQKGTKPGSSHENDSASRPQDTTLFGVQTRTPNTSRRKGPPPGLSIAAPAASRFTNDRVIQSAPLNQTFTGLRAGDQPYTHHSQHGRSGVSQTSHIHHVPATQTNNRLPPISDVFGGDRLYPGTSSPSHPNSQQAVPSPSFPTSNSHAALLSSRSREFRSAEEAVAGLSGGREDLMPKLVHYGGVQPPTPPSPMPHHGYLPPSHRSGSGALPGSSNFGAHSESRPDVLARTSSMNGRRRGRDEFERDNGSPPENLSARHYHNHAQSSDPKRPAVAFHGDAERDSAREADWRGSLSGSEKKAEFLRLCERAWDLFHS